MTKEQREELNEARMNLYDAIIADEDRFEKKITYLSAGAIALSLTFVANLKGWPCAIWALIHGLALVGVSLSMNMILYLWGKDQMRSMIAAFKKNIKDDAYPDPDPDAQIVDLSRKIDCRNKFNLWIMIGGIIFLVVFVCLNI